MHKVLIKIGKSKPFRYREPLVFSGAIASVEGTPEAGELVEVFDHKHTALGLGMFNPYSLYRVRLLSFHDDPALPTLADILMHRLQQALNFRQSCQLPNPHVTAYRLVNSEGDGLSGLTIDVYADHMVIAATAYWCMEHQQEVQGMLRNLLPNHQQHWLPITKSLQQDGWQQPVTEQPPLSVDIIEHDIKFQVSIYQGQKTGFYCDQRDNRKMLRQYVTGKNVLDCYCYTGGFALNAAYAGAKSIVAVDSSLPALKIAEQNALSNQVDNITFVYSKAEDYLRNKPQFDVIILDPPKLAPSQKHLPRAKNAYRKLNELALSCLPVGGLLLTCSCSDALNIELFKQIILQAAKAQNRKIEILKISGASADHRYLPKAQYGDYLKAVLLRVV